MSNVSEKPWNIYKHTLRSETVIHLYPAEIELGTASSRKASHAGGRQNINK